MDRFFVAVVMVILFALTGWYKADHTEIERVNSSLSDSLLVVNTEKTLVRDSLNDCKVINIILRGYISGSKERELRKDSTYLYLIDNTENSDKK